MGIMETLEFLEFNVTATRGAISVPCLISKIGTGAFVGSNFPLPGIRLALTFAGYFEVFESP